MTFFDFLAPLIEYLSHHEIKGFTYAALTLAMAIATVYLLRYTSKKGFRTTIDTVKLTAVFAGCFLYASCIFHNEPGLLTYPSGTMALGYFSGLTLLIFRFRRKKELHPVAASIWMLLILTGTFFTLSFLSLKMSKLKYKTDEKKTAHLTVLKTASKMSPNVIEEFYQAFQQMDAEAMAACYHQDVVFSDPAFGTLTGIHASNMWRMLINSQEGKDFRVTFSNVSFDGLTGTAHWEAWYVFSATNRQVHNQIKAVFEIRDGLITRHEDHFDLYKWSRQALGWQGVMLGWSGFFKRKLQSQTNRLLRKFESKLTEPYT